MNNPVLNDFIKMRQSLTSSNAIKTPLGGLPTPAGIPVQPKKKTTKKERVEIKRKEVAESLDALIESNPGKKDVARFFQDRANVLSNEEH